MRAGTLVVFTPTDPLPDDLSIFLAGPTPRSSKVASWRPEAFRLLADMVPPGEILRVASPEAARWAETDYDAQVAWEWTALNRSRVVAFWVPRVLRTMPAFTTNVEFGMMLGRRPCVLGYPPKARKMSYLDWHAERTGTPVYSTLEKTLGAAMIRALHGDRHG